MASLPAQFHSDIEWTWTAYVSSPVAVEKVIIPLAAMYRPLQGRKQLNEDADPQICIAPSVPPMTFENTLPLLCTNCGGIYNPSLCNVQSDEKNWTCVMCNSINSVKECRGDVRLNPVFGYEIQSVSSPKIPPRESIFRTGIRVAERELLPSLHTDTYEYILPPLKDSANGKVSGSKSFPTILFIVDCAMESESLRALCTEVEGCIERCPSNCKIGLITYGRDIHIHYAAGLLGLPSSLIFPGYISLSTAEVQKCIENMKASIQSPVVEVNTEMTRAQYREILRDIGVGGSRNEDGWKWKREIEIKRGWKYMRERALGNAISVALSVLEIVNQKAEVQMSASRLLVFAGGPCTLGPGAIIFPDIYTGMQEREREKRMKGIRRRRRERERRERERERDGERSGDSGTEAKRDDNNSPSMFSRIRSRLTGSFSRGSSSDSPPVHISLPVGNIGLISDSEGEREGERETERERERDGERERESAGGVFHVSNSMSEMNDSGEYSDSEDDSDGERAYEEKRRDEERAYDAVMGHSAFRPTQNYSTPDHPKPPSHSPKSTGARALGIISGLLNSLQLNSSASITGISYEGSSGSSGNYYTDQKGGGKKRSLLQQIRAPHIRTYADLEQSKHFLEHYHTQRSYYETLAKRAVDIKATVDMYCCSLDQTGLSEMNSLVKYTNGNVYLGTSFESDTFSHTLRQTYAPTYTDLYTEGERERESGERERERMEICFDGRVRVHCSPNIQVSGCLGHVKSAKCSGPQVSTHKVIGTGETCEWTLSGLSPSTCLGFYFHPASPSDAHKSREIIAAKKGGERAVYVQMQVEYTDGEGKRRLRVTTSRIALDLSLSLPSLSSHHLHASTWNALLVRLVSQRLQSCGCTETVAWLDRMVIGVVRSLSEWRKSDPASLSLSQPLYDCIEFIYHLRRSVLLNPANASLDERTYHKLLHVSLAPSAMVRVVWPKLWMYRMGVESVEPEVHAVPLDSRFLMAENVLLMDSFLSVVVWFGSDIVKWWNEGHYESNEPFRLLIDTVRSDSIRLVVNRFPTPQYVECGQHDSAARLLVCRLSAATSYTSTDSMGRTKSFSRTDSVDSSLRRGKSDSTGSLGSDTSLGGDAGAKSPLGTKAASRAASSPFISQTSADRSKGRSGEEIIYTDDSNLEAFVEKVKRHVVGLEKL